MARDRTVNAAYIRKDYEGSSPSGGANFNLDFLKLYVNITI